MSGPKGISATFTPIVGSPASCEPSPSVRFDAAACTFTGSIGAGLAGTLVTISATGYAGGTDQAGLGGGDELTPGAQRKVSECIVTMPEDGGRFGCTLF